MVDELNLPRDTRATGFTSSPSDSDTAAALIGPLTSTFGSPGRRGELRRHPGAADRRSTISVEFQDQLDEPSVTVSHPCRAAALVMVEQGLRGDREHQFVRVPGDHGGCYPAGRARSTG